MSLTTLLAMRRFDLLPAPSPRGPSMLSAVISPLSTIVPPALTMMRPLRLCPTSLPLRRFRLSRMSPLPVCSRLLRMEYGWQWPCMRFVAWVTVYGLLLLRYLVQLRVLVQNRLFDHW